ncbi:hypothetical protein [Clostridium sp. ZBS15]|uniref:hypothetical protein n=1 Tax=Clostridium sp. ZBS15 TaxID=2949969 RepID=UPI002079B464|nr:hypothetical protein [Clostridium sp. ZBS15]
MGYYIFICYNWNKYVLDKMSDLYINSNFKKKYMLMPASTIAGMQIKNVFKF